MAANTRVFGSTAVSSLLLSDLMRRSPKQTAAAPFDATGIGILLPFIWILPPGIVFQLAATATPSSLLIGPLVIIGHLALTLSPLQISSLRSAFFGRQRVDWPVLFTVIAFASYLVPRLASISLMPIQRLSPLLLNVNIQMG